MAYKFRAWRGRQSPGGYRPEQWGEAVQRKDRDDRPHRRVHAGADLLLCRVHWEMGSRLHPWGFLGPGGEMPAGLRRHLGVRVVRPMEVRSEPLGQVTSIDVCAGVTGRA